VLRIGLPDARLCGHPRLRPHGSQTVGGAAALRQGRGQRQQPAGEDTNLPQSRKERVGRTNIANLPEQSKILSGVFDFFRLGKPPE
jgi:hypothetical protein